MRCSLPSKSKLTQNKAQPGADALPGEGAKPTPVTPPPGAVRIISGVWRNRRLPVPDWPGLRPTPERVRETLFNWLQNWLEGARCLDAFAGTGALGLEAASRGAGPVVLMEREPLLVQALQQHLAKFAATQCELITADTLRWLAQPAYRQFDLVLLDPPFDRPADLAHAVEYLVQYGWLAPGARVYLEWPAYYTPPELPAHWQVLRRQRAGQVAYLLAAAG